MYKICLIFAPQPKNSSNTTVNNTIRLFEPLAEKLSTIIGNQGDGFLKLQFTTSQQLFKMRRQVDVVVMAAGASTFLLPALLAKLMRKKLLIMHPGHEALMKSVGMRKSYYMSNFRWYLEMVLVILAMPFVWLSTLVLRGEGRR